LLQIRFVKTLHLHPIAQLDIFDRNEGIERQEIRIC